MLRDYLDWWAAQMLSLVPERLRLSMVDSEEGLLIEQEPGGSTVRLSRLNRHAVEEVGRFPVDSPALGTAAAQTRPVVIRLRLPDDLLLEKRLSLPITASRDLDRVLAYEMDRETPFTASEAWWSFAIEQRDRQRGKVDVLLSLVPKASIETLLAALRRAGATPTLLEVALGDGVRRHIPIDAPERRARGVRIRRVPVAAAVCAGLLVIALCLPFTRQSWQMASIAARMAALKPTVEEAETLSRQLNESAGSDVLTGERARLGDPLAVLAAATALLPDDTYLTDFTMAQRKVTLNGKSAAAAKLIGAFADDPTFKDPAFAAPSTHVEGARTETFSIGAEARP